MAGRRTESEPLMLVPPVKMWGEAELEEGLYGRGEIQAVKS